MNTQTEKKFKDNHFSCENVSVFRRKKDLYFLKIIKK